MAGVSGGAVDLGVYDSGAGVGSDGSTLDAAASFFEANVAARVRRRRAER